VEELGISSIGEEQLGVTLPEQKERQAERHVSTNGLSADAVGLYRTRVTLD
jgi:hypothetical protein